MEKSYARPVIPLLLSFIAGITIGYWYPDRSLWAYSLIILSVGFVIIHIRIDKAACISPLILFACVGYLSIQSWVAPNFPSHHIIHFTDTHPLEISGTISSYPTNKVKRTQFYLNVKTLSHNENTFPATGKIRVTVAGESPELAKGDRINFISRIRSIRNFSNPGGFDYKTFMAFKNVRGTAYARGDKLVLLKPRGPKNAFDNNRSFRKTIAVLIENTGSITSSAILKALIIGEKTGIDPSLRDAFNRAGLGHLLAISGLHIGIVASFAFFILQRLLSFLSPLLWHGWVKKTAAFLSLIPVCIYGLISGMSPSTQRAVIMVAFFLMTFLFEREQDTFNTLAIAAMIILIVFPPSLFSVSFQLSFAAVAAILTGMSCIPLQMRPDAPILSKYVKTILAFLSVSLFAILGTLPLVMYYFNQVSLVGLFANCIGIPLIGFMVVPLGLASVFVYPLSAHLASFGFHLCNVILDQAIAIIRFISGFDVSAVKTITPNMLEILSFYLLFWGACHFRKSQGAKIMVGLLIVVLGADIAYWTHRRVFNDDLRITIFDVGQGFASLLEFPEGYTMMVDGGGFSDNSVFDVGARIIAPYLWQNKIRTVDTLILSHPNSDHLNGLIYIAEHFHVKSIWTNGEKVNTLGYRNFMSIISKNQINTPSFPAIPRSQTINGVRLKILNPPKDFLDSPIIAKLNNTNNNSIVIKASFGSISFLFPGDITQKTERRLVSSAVEDLSSTVLFSPHHGSKTSSFGPFLDRVNPKFVIISAGWKNRFHFPHPSVLKRYQDRGHTVFRTDLNGAVRIATNGTSLTINPTISADE